MRIEPAPSDAERRADEPGRRPPRRCRRWSRRGRCWTSHGLRVDAEGGRLGERPQRQLGHVRLADDHRARLAQAAHHLGVRLRGLAVGVGAARRHLARHVDVVLDRDRHAQQRPLRRRPRRRASAWSASSSARSANTTRNAFSRASQRAIRSRYSSTSSREETSPAAISSRLLGDPGEGEVGGVHRRGNLLKAAPRSGAPQRPEGARSRWDGSSTARARGGASRCPIRSPSRPTTSSAAAG